MAIECVEHRQIRTGSDWLERLGSGLRKSLLAMQYASMVRALNSLSDDQLHQIGITRGHIPGHARKCVYDSFAMPKEQENSL